MDPDLVTPFNPTEFEDINENPIHIRLVQRTGRKSVTIVEGYDFTEKEFSCLKKKLCCGGFKDETNHTFNGDVRVDVKKWLNDKGLKRIVMHGW